MPIAKRDEKDTAATDSAATADHEIFAPGEPCGVCRFPTGPGQICGNTVYASHGKGALPKYCGQEGQAQWQAQHGTEGDPGHRSDLAGYPRKRAGMSTADAAHLAEEEAARRGITRRKVTEPEAPPATAEPAESAPEIVPESAVAALAALVNQLPGRIATVREEIDSAYADRDARVAKEIAKREQMTSDVETEREALAQDRAEAQAARERAETEIREATDARLQTEGELRSAKSRIDELEQELAELKAAHRAEIEEVRTVEYERFAKMMDSFAATVRGTEPAAPQPIPVTEDVQRRMLERVDTGTVTVVDGTWHLSNAKANTAAAKTLDWLQQAGQIRVTGDGKVIAVR